MQVLRTSVSGGSILSQLAVPEQCPVSGGMEPHDLCPAVRSRSASENSLRGGQARAWAGQTFGRVFTPSILCTFKARDGVSLMFLSLALCILFYIHLISIDTFVLNK